MLPATARRVFQSSALSRSPAEVLSAASAAPIAITRRDSDPLVMLSKAEFEARDRLLELAAQIIAITTDEDGRPLGERFTDRFDWMLSLSPEEREDCARAIVRAARASFATGSASLAVAELAAWRSTAIAISHGLTGAADWLDEAEPVRHPNQTK